MDWAYGITTVPSRFHQYLPTTINSLKQGGFDNPVLFVDSVPTPGLAKHKLETTFRSCNLGAFGHWVLSAWELRIRNPTADFYAIFQDDFVCSKNLREYLEYSIPKIDNWNTSYYYNLYTVPMNESLCKEEIGWHESNQRGKGAVALVFPNQVLGLALSSAHFRKKPNAKKHPKKNIDGAVVSALNSFKISELVHYPSFTQHIGESTSLGNSSHPVPKSFKGEEFDLMGYAC